MPENKDPRMLDPGLTILALQGLSAPAAYPFVERHLWRKRAAGLFAALARVQAPQGDTQPATSA